MYSMAAQVPDAKPNLTNEKKKFVPRAVTITFKHSKYGKTIWSAQDNDFADHMMQWSSASSDMFTTDTNEVKTMARNITKAHKDAVVKTNCDVFKAAIYDG